MSERIWTPGDSRVLPEVDPRCYSSDSVPLAAVETRLCPMCGNVNDGDLSGLCADCL